MHVKINKIHANNLIHIVFNTHMYIHMHYLIIVLTIWGKKYLTVVRTVEKECKSILKVFRYVTSLRTEPFI